MKTDINRTSTCPAGKESYETFKRTTRVKGKNKSVEFIQYDYRTSDGKLFTIVKSTLEECRAARDAWFNEQGADINK